VDGGHATRGSNIFSVWLEAPLMTRSDIRSGGGPVHLEIERHAGAIILVRVMPAAPG
jgi:hypothetical protein